MIKRLLLIIAIIITILGIIFKINPLTLLLIDGILICAVLLITVLPWSIGCVRNPYASFFTIILIVLILIFIFDLFGFLDPISYTNTCFVTTTNANGSVISNISIKCP